VLQYQKWRRADSDDAILGSRVLIETRTYSAADWVSMRTYAAFVQALHNCGLTRLPAVYLRFTHGVAYDRFYRDLIDRHCEGSPLLAALKRRVEGCYASVVEDADAVDDMPLPELGEPLTRVSPSRWLFFHLCRNRDAFYRELAGFLGREHPGVRPLASLLDYQRQLVVLPDYEPKAGKTFPVEHDWPGYFGRALRAGSPEPLPEPPRRHGAYVQVEDGRGGDHGAFAWGEGAEERLRRWFVEAVLFGRAGANFRRVSLNHDGPLPLPAA
jgi:putative methyltransferase